MSPPVGNWADTPALKRLLETHELAAWQVTEKRVVVRLRARDGTVTFRSLSDIPVPACPELAESITQALSDRACAELLAGQRPQCAVSAHTSSGPLRARVSCSSRGINVQEYSESEWASEVAWHTYWQLHDYQTLDESLRAASPPAPRDPRTSKFLTWAAARTLLQAREINQLSLFASPEALDAHRPT